MRMWTRSVTVKKEKEGRDVNPWRDEIDKSWLIWGTRDKVKSILTLRNNEDPVTGQIDLPFNEEDNTRYFTAGKTEVWENKVLV